MTTELVEAEKTAQQVEESVSDVATQSKQIMVRLNFDSSPEGLEKYRENYAEAARCYNELHRIWNHGEDQRLEFTKPLNDVIRKINATFKAKLDPIDQMKKALKRVMEVCANAELIWKRAEEAKQREIERKRLEEIALSKAQAAADIGQNETADKILEKPIIPRVNVESANDRAATTSMTKWSARVIDKAAFVDAVAHGKIDLDYVFIDEQRIKNMARTAKGKIPAMPGIEVFEEVQVGASIR